MARDQHYINGVPRNVVIRLSEDELAAMAAELRSRRRKDKTSRWERRKEYIKQIKGEQDEQY